MHRSWQILRVVLGCCSFIAGIGLMHGFGFIATASAKEAAGEQKGPSDEARLEAELAVHFRARRYSEARRSAEQLLGLQERRLSARAPKLISVLATLTLLYAAENDFPSALGSALRALQIEEAAHGPDTKQAGELQQMITGLYRRMNDSAHAAEHAERALRILQKTGGGDQRLLQSLCELGDLYLELKDTARSNDAYARALRIQEKTKTKETVQAARLFRSMGQASAFAGDASKAAAFLRRALALFEKLPGVDGRELAMTLIDLGLAVEGVANGQESIALYQRAQRLFEAASDDKNVLECSKRLGRLLFQAARYRDAILAFQRALLLAQKLYGPTSSEVATLCSDLALAHANAFEFEKAEQLYQRALALIEREKGPQSQDVAALLANFAGIYDEMGQAARALPLYERALAIRKLGQDPRALAIAEQDLALSRQRLEDFAAAETGYSRAFAILEAAKALESEEAEQVLGNWASLYADRGEWGRAETLARRVLALAEKLYGADSAGMAHPANNLGDYCKEQGKFEEAEREYERAHRIWERELGAEHPLVGLSLNNLGSLRLARADHVGAKAFFQRALAIVVKAQGPNHPDAATTLNNLANLELNRGNYVEAEPLLEQALRIFERAFGPRHVLVATALNNLGSLKLQRGDSKRAEELFARSLEIVERLGNRRAIAKTQLNLGVLYDMRNDAVRAEGLFRRSLALLRDEQGTDVPDLAQALLGLASTRLALGDGAEAESLLERARAIAVAAEGEAGPGVARIDGSLAQVATSRGRYPQAESLYQRAVEALRRTFGDDHPDVAKLSANEALLYWEEGKREKAVGAMQRGMDARERHVSRTLSAGSAEQRRLFLSASAPETDWAVNLHLQGFPDDRQAERLALLGILRSKGRLIEVVQDTTRALREHLGSDERLLFDELRAVRSRIAQKVFTSRASALDPEQSRSALAQLGKQADELEARIAARSALFRSVAQPVTIEQVARGLPAGTALVELVNYQRFDPRGEPLTSWHEQRYAAYVLRGDQSLSSVDLGPAASIDALVREFRDVLRNPRSNPETKARELDERVMRPVRRLVGDLRNLIVSADGSLSLVPFGALMDERRHYLADEWSIRYLSTGRELLRSSSDPSRSAALVVAAPTFDEPAHAARRGKDGAAQSTRNQSSRASVAAFRPLPGTLDEGRAVAKSLDVGLLSGSAASVAALLAVKGPRILHVATHGFFFGGAEDRPVHPSRGVTESAGGGPAPPVISIDPLLRSGLALAGANLGRSDDTGILTALEASSLDLWGTRLVVLSACDTGVGTVVNRDGVYGLRRALTLAGAESLVTSLWKVDDAATRDLMIAYYDALSKGGNRAASLHDVQRSMRRSARYSHPYYWASFIAFGAEGPLGAEPNLPEALPGLGAGPPRVQPLRGARGCGCRLANERSAHASSAWFGAAVFCGWLALARRRARRAASSAPRRSALAPEA